MEKTVLNAKVRQPVSKGELNRMKKSGRVPGVFYHKDSDTISLDVAANDLNPLIFTADTHLISLQIEGHEEYECVVKDIQFDPLTDKVIHFDLLGLTRGEKFQLEIPIQLAGSAIGVKEGGIVQHIMHKVGIECLPKDIPSHLEVDITALKIGDAIHIGDLKYDDIALLDPEDSVVVAVTHPKIEKVTEELEEEEEAAAEPEVIGKGKEEESEASEEEKE